MLKPSVLFRYLSSLMLILACAHTAHAQLQGYDIIIVAGQSNAVGFGSGPSDSLADKGLESYIRQISRYDDVTLSVIGVSEAQALHHHNWKERNVLRQAGFALPIARRYVQTALAANRRVLIVPAAMAGTHIAPWQPGKTYYEDMKKRISYALRIGGLRNRIVAFHWQQGEADIKDAGLLTAATSRANAAANYKAQLLNLVDGVRRDFASQGQFPIMIGEPSRLVGPGMTNSFLDAQARFVDSMAQVTRARSCLGFVHSDNLDVNGSGTASVDYVHFSAAGQTLLGTRHYNKLMALGNCIPGY